MRRIVVSRCLLAALALSALPIFGGGCTWMRQHWFHRQEPVAPLPPRPVPTVTRPATRPTPLAVARRPAAALPTSRPTTRPVTTVVRRPTTLPASVPATVPAGPQVMLGGLRDSAVRVVFVCDASGANVRTFDKLRLVLNGTVADLRPPQSFGLVLFREGKAIALDKELLPATWANAKRSFDFLAQARPAGGSDPVPALRAALALRPDVIYLLTPGDFPNNNAVRDLFRPTSAGPNTGGKARLNIVVTRPPDAGTEIFLRHLARDTGGQYKLFDEEELWRELNK